MFLFLMLRTVTLRQLIAQQLTFRLPPEPIRVRRIGVHPPSFQLQRASMRRLLGGNQVQSIRQFRYVTATA